MQQREKTRWEQIAKRREEEKYSRQDKQKIKVKRDEK